MADKETVNPASNESATHEGPADDDTLDGCEIVLEEKIEEEDEKP